MKKPIYIRDGSRFRKIDYYTGMFWNLDGSFTDVEKDNSIGIVVSQDGNELTIASLKLSTFKMTWDEAKEHCNSFSSGLPGVRLCYLPTRSELLSVVDNFGGYLYSNNSCEWTSTEHSSFYAWALDWYTSEGGLLYDYKGLKNYVRKFFKVEV